MCIDFKAAWCGPCKACAPVLAAISLQHPGIEFGAVDVDELQSVAQRWGVSAMPTFIVFRGGTPFRTIVAPT